MPRDTIHKHRKRFETPVQSIEDTLQSVELNIVELCNRKCPFCPRGHDYKSRAVYMSEKTASAIGGKLSNFGYSQGITFSGFGEPLLHYGVIELARIIKSYLPSLNRYEIITNGDYLTVGKIHDLLSSGITTILVNLYDSEQQVELYQKMFQLAGTDNYILRHHYYGPEEDYGLTINNRAGSVSDRKIDKPKCQACFLPFYKMVVDWDGGIILCPQDWKRTGNLDLNINTHTLKDIWFSDKLNTYRKRLKTHERTVSPCNTCDVQGNIHGLQSFNAFVEKFEE